MVVLHTAVSALGGILTVLILLAAYRRSGVAAWGWIASFLPDLPVLWLAPLGVTGLEKVMLLTHTAGILIFPALLVVIDFLLAELALVRRFSWLPYPPVLRTIARIGRWADRLERYHAIPRPARFLWVYTAGVLAGAVHLAVNLAVGFL